MKIAELLFEQKDSDKPHLYLDMDGVQADFFGAWAKKLDVDSWRAINDKEKEINMLAQSSPEEVYDFFRNLKPLSSGLQLVSWLKENNIPFTVLSAPLRGHYAEASVQAKKDWLDQYKPGTSSNAIFTQNKHKYAITNDTKNVLVDDYGKYLNAWDQAGGIAIKHDEESENPNTAENTIKKLKQIYKV